MKHLLSFSIFCFLSICGQSKDTLTVFDQFSRDDILKITLETNMGYLIKKKFKENYQEATLSYQDSNGEDVSQKLKIRARGNSRKSTCFYPPLKLKFAKSGLQDLGLDTEFNKIKLVCQCRRGNLYEQYLIKEYLTYRLFNEVTTMSFKVQLVEINFVDSSEKMKSFVSYGFLIEPASQLAARFEGTSYRATVLNPKYTLPEQTNLLYIFQYMVGNTDWAITNNHNIYSFRSYNYALPVCIPYDFDYSGLVNTIYAVPNDKLHLESVTQRLFRGICRELGTYESIIESFIDRKTVFYKIINDCSQLEPKSQRWMLSYLEEFFTIAENPRYVERSVVSNCRD